MADSPDKQRQALYRGFGQGFAFAVELVAVPVGGYFLGRILDGKWGTAPWMAISLLVFGFAGGFIRLYYYAKLEEEDKGVPERGSTPEYEEDERDRPA